jgi:hypothetical protein
MKLLIMQCKLKSVSSRVRVGLEQRTRLCMLRLVSCWFVLHLFPKGKYMFLRDMLQKQQDSVPAVEVYLLLLCNLRLRSRKTFDF